MTTENTYEALNISYGHDPATLKQTVSIVNDPLPEHVLMGQELFQALYQAGIPWAKLRRVDADDFDQGETPETDSEFDPGRIYEDPTDWRVSFDVTGLEATYAVLGVQTYEPYAVQLELKNWSTK